MPDKTANWGVPGSGARYRTQDSDPTGGGNFVVAERLDSNGDPVDVLLEWDETAGEWVSGGPVNLDGSDVTNVGALDAESVSTEDIEISGPIETVSNYSTVQSAIDAVGGGTLIINETRTESQIEIDAANDGLTVLQPSSSHWIEQPTDAAGEEVWVTNQNESEIKNISFVGVQVRNPNLTEGDILNDDTLGPGISPTRGAWELNRADGGGPDLINWSFINCHAEFINGYGIFPRYHSENLTIRGFTAKQLGFDGVVIQNDDATAPTTAKVSDSHVEDAGRHSFAVAGSENIRAEFVNVYGLRPYLCGFDMEPNASTDHQIRVTGTFEQTHDGGTAVPGGVAQSVDSGELTGDVTVIDPNRKGLFLKDRLNLTASVEQSAAQNPNNENSVTFTPEVSGSIDLDIDGGGSDVTAISMDRTNSLSVDATVRDAYASSVRMTFGEVGRLDLVSETPVQGGTNIDAEYRTHLAVDNGTTDAVVTIKATDGDGNAEYAILSDGAGDDHNNYRGNVRNAYTTEATSGTGANSDTSDLIT